MAVKKWMGPEAARQEKAGTAGSLRAIAQRRGLIKGEETLTEADLNTLANAARKMKGKDGKLSPQGLELIRKVGFARNAMKAKK